MGRMAARDQSADRGVLKEAECSLEYEYGVVTSLCGRASRRDRWLADPTVARRLPDEIMNAWALPEFFQGDSHGVFFFFFLKKKEHMLRGLYFHRPGAREAGVATVL